MATELSAMSRKPLTDCTNRLDLITCGGMMPHRKKVPGQWSRRAHKQGQGAHQREESINEDGEESGRKRGRKRAETDMGELEKLSAEKKGRMNPINLEANSTEMVATSLDRSQLYK